MSESNYPISEIKKWKNMFDTFYQTKRECLPQSFDVEEFRRLEKKYETLDVLQMALDAHEKIVQI